jgi:transcriptional regulator GlxA family with amidase domain
VGDIAEAIGVKRRTLQRAFHDVLGTGVASFVRKTKLTAVRAELIDSDPGITSVTDVATKYGFTELGRFSVQYRSRFAESPSETLRREPIG